MRCKIILDKLATILKELLGGEIGTTGVEFRKDINLKTL